MVLSHHLLGGRFSIWWKRCDTSCVLSLLLRLRNMEGLRQDMGPERVAMASSLRC